MDAMADNYPGNPQSQPSPEPDPWATMPRQNLTPPGDESPFARPAANPWQPPDPVEQAEPTAVQPPVEPAQPENPYDTSPSGSEPTSQLPPFPGSTPPPPPPAAPYAAVGLLVLLVGWIPVLLSIAFTRFVLEGIVALIRIHDRVTEMAERDKAS